MNRQQAMQTIENRGSVGDLRNLADDIAKHIHYPECWDTMAYPTLKDAIVEIVYSAGCSPEYCTK